MKASAEKHLDKATMLIAVAESGDTKRAAYKQAADEILAAMAEDDTLTQVKIAQRIGKGRTWVVDLLAWRKEGGVARATPFARDDWEQRKQQIATKTPVKHADKVKMAEQLLEDPKVVKSVLAKPTVASRGITNAVVAKESTAKKKRAEQDAEYNERRKESLPGLAGRASAIVTKVDQWAIELDTIRESLWELDGRTAELVDMAHENLIRAAEANRQELGRPSKLRVIEGSVTRTG